MSLHERMLAGAATPAGRADSSLLGIALEYGRRGFRVLPVYGVRFDGGAAACTCSERPGKPGGVNCPSKGKHPRLGAWQKLATSDLVTIERWWALYPDDNIGLAMGGDTRLVAIDVDGELGRNSIAEFEARNGNLPVTLTSRSGRLDIGHHRIFRVSEEFDLAKVRNRVGFAPGLDVRATGGQIVAPPSRHESGRTYVWEHPVPVADMPRWLYEAILVGQARKLSPVKRVSAVADDLSFDMGDLRSHLVSYRRKLANSEDDDDIQRHWIAGKLLEGKPFAVPGKFEGETDLLRGRDPALNMAMSILAWRLPVEVPLEAAIEIIRPSLMAMDCEPEGFDHWLEEAVDMFERASARRDEVRAQEEAQNRTVLQSMNRRRVAAGMPPVESIGGVDPGLAEKIRESLSKDEGEESEDEGPDESEGVNNVDEEEAKPIEEIGEVEDDLFIISAVGEIPRMVDDAIRALAIKDQNLYQRAGDLVYLAREPQKPEEYVKDKRAQNNVLVRPGTPRIRVMAQAHLITRLSLAAKWVKLAKSKKGNSERWVELNPDPATAADIMARHDWYGIKPLKGIIETPVLTPSGKILMDGGYDPETTYVHLPSVHFDPIPDRPTQYDAQMALKLVWIELFSDFPYRGMPAFDLKDVTREARYDAAKLCPDAFVGIALILSILARPFILGAVPGSVFEASTPGSGKSLQINIASVVTTGRAASLATFPMGRDGKPNEEELEKMLGAYALAGMSLIAFDNIKGFLGGPALEKVQSAVDTVALRILGASELRIMPWFSVIAFSGNNMSMAEDVAQRNLLSRLESHLEDPRSRPKEEFRHTNILAWIKEHRVEIVRAFMIIMRAWVVAENRPDPGQLGSFEFWSSVVPSMILYAGGPNVLLSRPKDVQTEDTGSDAHRALMEHWAWPEPIKAADVVKKLFEGETAQQRDNPHARGVPKGFAEMREAVRVLTNTPEGKSPSPTQFGYALRKLRDKIRGGLKLTGKPNRDDVVEWRVVRVS
jgi:hypothetical protein